MKIEILMSFREKLGNQIIFIAKDKPVAARKFKKEIIRKIKQLPENPYSNRKSIYFNRPDIRDLIFKGYTVVYKIDEIKKTIYVFGFTRFENNPFS
ncbi:MAG: type II toxin-antitoxin system RelE/ParE family toxin [Draconibacterium sp.]|nr:type II toxin-antitoxin system RelE/ParE family toxin [Draconibacterium sp.]